MSGSADERLDRARQPQTTVSEPTNAGADDVAETANHVDDPTGHGSNATSDRTRSSPNGLQDSSAGRGKGLAHPPNSPEREAGSTHQGANEPRPHGSDSSAGSRRHPPQPGGEVPGEADDRTGHPGERVTQAPQHGAD